jgi:hypothetical protein
MIPEIAKKYLYEYKKKHGTKLQKLYYEAIRKDNTEKIEKSIEGILRNW